MRSGVGRAALGGALLAVVLTLLVAGGAYWWSLSEQAREPLEEVLVLATAPGPQGGEVATVAFVVDSSDGTVEILDTLEETSVAGTSARNPRDAYPFGGGAATASALVGQTGGVVMDWVTLPPGAWAALIDKAGGMSIEVPEGFSAYTEGTLTVLRSGESTITGDEAVALAASAEFFADDSRGPVVLERLSAEISGAVLSNPHALRDLVANGEAKSSVAAGRVPVITTSQ